MLDTNGALQILSYPFCREDTNDPFVGVEISIDEEVIWESHAESKTSPGAFSVGIGVPPPGFLEEINDHAELKSIQSLDFTGVLGVRFYQKNGEIWFGVIGLKLRDKLDDITAIYGGRLVGRTELGCTLT